MAINKDATAILYLAHRISREELVSRKELDWFKEHRQEVIDWLTTTMDKVIAEHYSPEPPTPCQAGFHEYPEGPADSVRYCVHCGAIEPFYC